MNQAISDIKQALFQRQRELKQQHDAIDRVEHLAGELSQLGLSVDLSLEGGSENGPAPVLKLLVGVGDLVPEVRQTGENIVNSVPDFPGEPAPEPTPEQVPEKVARPAKIAGAKKPAKKTGRGFWSKSELATATDILKNGGTARDVAAATGRPLPASTAKCVALRREMGTPARSKPRIAPDRAPDTPPDPKPQSNPQSDVLSDPHPGEQSSPAAAPFAERRVEALLNALGHVGPWDTDLDLEVVELFAGGSSAGVIAETLGLTKQDVINRFRALCPDPTPETQTTLLCVLRRRVIEERAA